MLGFSACPCKFSAASFCSVYFSFSFCSSCEQSKRSDRSRTTRSPPVVLDESRGELDVVRLRDIHPTARRWGSKKWPEPFIVSTMLMASRSPVFFGSWLKNRPTRDALPPNSPLAPMCRFGCCSDGWLELESSAPVRAAGYFLPPLSPLTHREEHLTSAVTGAAAHRSSHDAFQSRLARKIE